MGALTIDDWDIRFLEIISNEASQLLLLGVREKEYPHPIIRFNSSQQIFAALT